MPSLLPRLVPFYLFLPPQVHSPIFLLTHFKCKVTCGLISGLDPFLLFDDNGVSPDMTFADSSLVSKCQREREREREREIERERD